jgi:biofilm PGA synthesis N-glycosyltransferase PgaC
MIEIILKLVFWASLLLILYTYVLYPLLLVLISKCKKDTPIIKKELSKELPLVTMVVAAYNEEKFIEEKINNFLLLDYPIEKIDLIIGSDNSSDNTNYIIEKYQKIYERVKLIKYKERNGKTNILNRTVPKATGEIIIFSDANTVYKKDSIKKLITGFNDERVGVVCGKLVLLDQNGEAGNYEGVYWKYENLIKRYENKIKCVLGANGGIYAMKKKLFVPVPSTVICDDFIFPIKATGSKYYIKYEESAIAYEEISPTVNDEFKRKVRISAGNFMNLLLLKEFWNPFKNMTNFFFFSHKLLRWISPFLLIIMLITSGYFYEENLYFIFFLCQMALYVLSTTGYILQKFSIQLKLFNIPKYFVIMNLALLLGFFKYIFKTQKVTWEKTR